MQCCPSLWQRQHWRAFPEVPAPHEHGLPYLPSAGHSSHSVKNINS